MEEINSPSAKKVTKGHRFKNTNFIIPRGDII